MNEVVFIVMYRMAFSDWTPWKSYATRDAAEAALPMIQKHFAAFIAEVEIPSGAR